ncbi:MULTISPECIES: FAD-dependent oxidoreductase [unclassified Beijerinckia]|uniref:NAD(P)/FAD-dependent oxidoreductase n=1 Tax=unclassified Beijerinckia TaxID=2638183 RepID=UPI000898A210|nr:MULTISPECIES: FAD-dependent oxidoreductase [unclassified Beijerinckia]MDH7795637.1 NADH dehydrogenase [Beijerinckia sp. GAS462]SEC09749.1 NADH dehydrogenase [Beijerinckia sp. 28-YEA-48]
MKRIVVLGAGFAGLWSAVGAARKLDELGIARDEVEVVVINKTAFHSIRVRNYEAQLEETIVPLSEVLDPIGVRWIEGEVSNIDVDAKVVTVETHGGSTWLSFDRLVFALGSKLVRPAIKGLGSYAFDVDTYHGAKRLEAHLAGLRSNHAPGRSTALVVGAGLTGIEIAAELPGRLRKRARSDAADVKVILADRAPRIGQEMGEAQPVIEHAMAALGVELRPSFFVREIDEQGAMLTSGERIFASTVIWCGGMQAHPMTDLFSVAHDKLGRLPVDSLLRVKGAANVFAAGDAASLLIDGRHDTMMSCQHGRPMGRFAGHNVVCDLLGLEMLPLQIDWYTTVLDLGPWGAVYTHGWDRRLAAEGMTAKRVKQRINGERIYPPRTGRKADIFNAAKPTVDDPPKFAGASR